MKSIVTFFILLFFLSCDSQTTSQTPGEIVFKSVNVIPMDKEQVLQNQDVIVKDGKILAIGESGKVKYNKKAILIDGKGKYLIPGLAEMHTHVPPSDDIQQMKDVLLLYTLKGITTIRGMLGHPKHLQLREQLKKGEIVGPHFYTSGPSFNGNSVKSPEAAETMVIEQKKCRL